MPRSKPEGGGWEENNQRVTFYCPVDLAHAIRTAAAVTGRSKNRVIVDALRAGLLVDAPDAEEATS